MHVEEILDEEEYKRLCDDLTFDISGRPNSPASPEILDFEEGGGSLCFGLEDHQLDHSLGTHQLASKVHSPCTTPPKPHHTFMLSQPYPRRLTPLEQEFLDRVSVLHSQTDKIRQSFDEARRRVETDSLILELHREVRQRHRQHLNTTHNSLPRNS